MQATNLWHQLNLHRAQITLLLWLLPAVLHAQSFRWARKNNPDYDEKRKLTYGFLIGLHTTTYQLKYSDLFVTPALDTVHSVVPLWKPGFSLGFLVNYRAHEFLDIRLMPTVGFYENELQYRFTNGQSQRELVETTMVEFPVLVKYKSMRRGNIRMYMVGGVKPGIEASGKKEIENVINSLEISGFNLSLEAGIGFDLYFPLFKLSPEIRFSRGLYDILDNTENNFGKPLKNVNTNTVHFYFIFQ
ncbi:MAG: hypothetical protein KatS3mg032_1298 [Cyclobacteriaceae bacterium]|nr:MAG: hypothetical protein KatS3mg032_1298 [Cyclobacteriaceae bacterium]